MESDVKQLAISDRLLAWVDSHRKQVLWGAIAVLAAALVAGLVIIQARQKLTNANEALSKAIGHGLTERPTAESILQVAEKYPDTEPGKRALLIGGGELFKQGKYAEAQGQFEKFLRDYRNSPFANQAFIGIAASLDAQGKTNEAITAYESIASRRTPDNTIPQAQFALARIYEAQGNLPRALELYETVRRAAPNGHFGDEAGMRWQELRVKHPELVPKPVSETPALTPGMPPLQSQPAPLTLATNSTP